MMMLLMITLMMMMMMMMIMMRRRRRRTHANDQCASNAGLLLFVGKTLHELTCPRNGTMVT